MKADAPIDILTELTTLINTISDIDGYQEVAPDNSIYPFVTYTLDNSFSDGQSTEVFYLYVDGWDAYNDLEANGTERLELMMSSVAQVLNQKCIKLTSTSLRFILDGRKAIYEPDASIRRRRHTYQVRYVGKE